MGTLLGHALPGSFFLLLALWRLLQIVRRQQLLRHCRHSHVDFYTSATYPCYITARCSRWPLEGAVKVLTTSIGIVGELYASTDYGRAGKIKWMGDIQHVTMYGLFLLSGLVDLLVWCCGTGKSRQAGLRVCKIRCPGGSPPGMDFVALSMAFFGEFILFSEHTHGRSEIDKHLHYLLLFVLAATCVSVLMECRFNTSLITALTTCYLLIAQGTWFIQVGLLLYPVPGTMFAHFQYWLYDQTVSEQLVIATMIFTWHLGAVFVFVCLTYLLLHKLFARCCICKSALNVDNIEVDLNWLIDADNDLLTASK